MKNIFLLHGPNLNLLGQRQPEIYGYQTLADIEKRVHQHIQQYQAQLTCLQSNYEGELIESIHQARENTHGIIINAGAYSHTSIAIFDALSSYPAKVVEVHLSNIYQRETFRHHSYIALRANAVIAGLGILGYLAAADYLLDN